MSVAVAAGMEHLPALALECIAKYLSPSDLAHCCAVSHSWRRIFDSDEFWRKHYNKDIADYLKVAKCEVEPCYSSLSEESAHLLPVSCCRESFLKEARLWHNWRSSNYNLKYIDFNETEDEFVKRKSRFEFGNNIPVEFLNNDHILIYRDCAIEVWDVSQKETCFVLDIAFNLNDMQEENLYKVVGNKLVVVQSNVVKVFDLFLESKTSNLAHLFFFDHTEEFSSQKLSDAKNTNDVFKGSSFKTASNYKHVICGIFLVGIVTTDATNLAFHVWNIKSGKKIKKGVCPSLPSVPIACTLKAVEMYDTVLVIFEFRHSPISSVFLFDLKKLEFGLEVQCTGENFILCNRYLCALTNKTITVFDTANGSGQNASNTFTFEHCDAVRLFKNKLLVLVREYEYDKVNLFEIDPAKAHLKEVKLIAELHDYNGPFDVIQDRFFVYDNHRFSLKIWEVGECTKEIMWLSYDDGLYRAVNGACTRIVLDSNDTFTVLSCW